MKVAVYHPFTDLADNYSLSHVSVEQMMMLTEHGVETHFITANSFEDYGGQVPKKVKIHKVLTHSNPKEILKGAEPIVSEMTTILTHDIAYRKMYGDHANAIEQLNKKYPLIKWLHWIHSTPFPQNKIKPLPGYYVGVNYTDLTKLAEQFQIPVGKCVVIYNSVSPDLFFNFHPFTRKLIEKYRLLECDVLMTYPLDTGRFQDKGGFDVVTLVEELRKKKMKGIPVNAKIVFVNAASNAKERKKLIKQVRKDKEEFVIFTSEEDKKYEVYTPHQIVRDLQLLSNVMPLLSDHEGCSLVMLEAALTKNMIILNRDFRPNTEFGETDNVMYMNLGSGARNINVTYRPNKEVYMRDRAQEVIDRLSQNPALLFNRKVLKRFNRDYVFHQQVEPLLI